MFQLTELRKTRAWQQIHEEGVVEGIENGFQIGFKIGFEIGKSHAHQKFARNCLANGMSIKETAKLTGVSVVQVRRLAKQAGK